jgi:hypothetical protein
MNSLCENFFVSPPILSWGTYFVFWEFVYLFIFDCSFDEGGDLW